MSQQKALTAEEFICGLFGLDKAEVQRLNRRFEAQAPAVLGLTECGFSCRAKQIPQSHP